MNPVIDAIARMPADPERCFALVPIKARALCKGRLAGSVDVETRLELVRFMLARVLAALAQADGVGHVAVVSAERDTVPGEIAVLADPGRGLNAALEHAQHGLLELGAREIVVLPADLPHVTAEDIDALIRAGRAGGCALAPDSSDTGTNALYWSCERRTGGSGGSGGAGGAVEASLRFQFGSHSKQRHLAQARRLGLRAHLVHRPGLAFDVDTPADLAQLWELPRAPRRAVQHA
ncbi:MAG: 2-phospho-L-lactate guanylyltransferase [Steroidobacteraceae bacterium]